MPRQRVPKFPSTLAVTAEPDGPPVLVDGETITAGYVATYRLHRVVLQREVFGLAHAAGKVSVPPKRTRKRKLQASEADGETEE
jgi:hypothetical protein